MKETTKNGLTVRTTARAKELSWQELSKATREINAAREAKGLGSADPAEIERTIMKGRKADAEFWGPVSRKNIRTDARRGR